MQINRKIDKFIYGFIPGLIVPLLFMWAYLERFYPNDVGFYEALAQMFPSVLLAKLLMLAAIPNFVITFIFYKSDKFKIATGFFSGGMPYLVASFFMM